MNNIIYEFSDPKTEKQRLWEEAHEWAVAEILSKYRKELQEAQSRHFAHLIERAEAIRQALKKKP